MAVKAQKKTAEAVLLIESMAGNVALFSEQRELIVASEGWRASIRLDAFLKIKTFKNAWNLGFKRAQGIPSNRSEELIFFVNPEGADDCCRLLMSPWQERSVVVTLEHSTFHRQIMAGLDEVKALQISKSHFEEMGEMAGGLAHEINNPLTVVLLKSLQMKKILQTEGVELNRRQMEDSANKIALQAQRIAKIVKGLMNFSRDASKDPLVGCQVSVLVEESIALCSEKIRLSGVEIKVGNLERTDIVYCRAVQLMQVLVNILNNACDAVTGWPDPKIEVKFRHTQQQFDIMICDNGPGIPLEYEEKIFKPFFTTKPAGLGSGLGLSISNNILNKHGGSLFLDRSVGNSCFVIRMPVDRR